MIVSMEGLPLISVLGELGFTEYEAKVYLALLKESPLSGYGIARASGVPRSKVYEVLRGMVGRGEVLVSHGEPVRYAPLPTRELISGRRLRAEESIRAAEEGLERYAAEDSSSGLIWDITGRAEILGRAREVVGRAEGSVLLQVWREDAPELRGVLAEASERGVEVTVVAYGEPDYPFASVYLHDLAEEITRQFGGRWIILSADAREIVAGIVSLGGESRAAWSSHPGMVVPITEQIRHDLYIAELLLSHRDVLEESFGPSLIRLREKFGPYSPAVARVSALLDPEAGDGA